MHLIVSALKECLDGVIITNAVGTLHGPVGLEQGWFHSLVRTAILDVMGWACRGRRQEEIKVGDVTIADDVKTSLVGPFTPLGAGQFVSFYHNGIHQKDDKFFNITRNCVRAIQGRCSISQHRFITGPQFEGPADKIGFRALGDDTIGMSGIQEMLSCTLNNVPFANLLLATNGPFVVHSHEDNQKQGAKNTEKAAAIFRELAKNWPRR